MSLADSFLADLEDIEGEAAVSLKIEEGRAVSECSSHYSHLLSAPIFREYMSRLSMSQSAPSLEIMPRASEDFMLISKSNIFLPQIDAEIYAIYKFVADRYSKCFPELEQLVLMPMDYIRVVERMLGDSRDISSVDLGFLPTNLAVAITVTASTSSLAFSHSLLTTDLLEIRGRIETAKILSDYKHEIHKFLSSQMPRFAPNLSALLGPHLSAQLVASAGGLESLATMPSQNIEAVGAHKQGLSGLSASFQQAKLSLISQCDLVQSAGDDVKRRAIRLVMGKITIAARVDQFNRTDRLGTTGSKLRDEIKEALRKASEPPCVARTIKALSLPDDKPKQRRGGKRLRNWKEKYGQTEVQKNANRLEFGSAQGDLEIDGVTVGKRTGMALTELGGGRIKRNRHITKNKKLKLVPSASSNAGVSQNHQLAFTASGIQIQIAPLAPKSCSTSNNVFPSLLFEN